MTAAGPIPRESAFIRANRQVNLNTSEAYAVGEAVASVHGAFCTHKVPRVSTNHETRQCVVIEDTLGQYETGLRQMTVCA